MIMTFAYNVVEIIKISYPKLDTYLKFITFEK